MSATDELRRLLDGRGVAWTAPNSCLRDEMTSWAAGGFYYDAFEVPEPDGTFLLTAAHQDDLTPEQAVEATLGRGTCEVVSSMDMTDVYEYAPTSYWHFEMTCGGVFDWTEPEPPSFCPCCGRKVVDA